MLVANILTYNLRFMLSTIIIKYMLTQGFIQFKMKNECSASNVEYIIFILLGMSVVLLFRMKICFWTG